MSMSRRRVLGSLAGAGLAGTGLAGAGWAEALRASPARAPGRHIALLNLHTDEHLEIEYFRDGEYIAAAQAKIERLLRDFRNGEVHAIDPALLDYLVDVAAKSGREARFGVICGYRSSATNEQLRERSSGVAQRSLHLQGRAIDVRMAGIDCADLATLAEGMRRGGVGYYRASDFVHLDTGAPRTWRG